MQAVSAASGAGWVKAVGRSRPVLLCFSHLRWNFVYQRPQHLMTRAARHYDVIFFEEPVVDAVEAAHLHRAEVAPGVEVAVPVVPPGLAADDVLHTQRRLLDARVQALGARPQVLWFYTPMALEFARHLGAEVVVYDKMDELSAFRNAPPALLALERELLARSDLLFCGGRSLYEASRGQHPDAHAFPSSIDRRHFAQARESLPDPPDQAALAHPRIGFFGVIDERFDLDLLDALARARPAWQWVMVGPTAKIDPATLPRHPNVHWLGMRSYDALPAYLAHWDVGVMPFALNESTRFISPTKTPEFLAAAVPVVAAPIRDVIRPYGERGLVEIAGSADQWLAAIERLLDRERHGDVWAWRAEVDRFLAGTSWQRTWMAMHTLITATAAARQAPAAATRRLPLLPARAGASHL